MEKIKPHSDTAPLLWLALVLSIAMAIAFLLPVTPQDYWWYLRIGRDTLASGAIPRVDTLTYSQAGSPVVYFSWGAALLFWRIYQLGGLSLTLLVRGLLIGGLALKGGARLAREMMRPLPPAPNVAEIH